MSSLWLEAHHLSVLSCQIKGRTQKPTNPFAVSWKRRWRADGGSTATDLLRISFHLGLPTSSIGGLCQLKGMRMAMAACRVGPAVELRNQALPVRLWMRARFTIPARSGGMPQRSVVSWGRDRRSRHLNKPARCSSAEVAAAEAWVTATGVPIFQRMMAKGVSLQVRGPLQFGLCLPARRHRCLTSLSLVPAQGAAVMGAQALLLTAAAAVVGRALLSLLDGKVGLWAGGTCTPGSARVSEGLCCRPRPHNAGTLSDACPATWARPALFNIASDTGSPPHNAGQRR